MKDKGFRRCMFNKIWDLGIDWNRDHEDDEIFVCEDYDENGDLKLYIEDDYVIITE